MYVFVGKNYRQPFEKLEDLEKNWNRLQVFDKFLGLKKRTKTPLPIEDSPRMKIKKDRLRRVMLKAWEYLADGTAQTKSEALKMAWKWAKSAKEIKRSVKTKNQTLLF